MIESGSSIGTGRLPPTPFHASLRTDVCGANLAENGARVSTKVTGCCVFGTLAPLADRPAFQEPLREESFGFNHHTFV
jgi:hypothetical protein